MTKLFSLIIVSLLLTTLVFSEGIRSYEYELVKTFEVGKAGHQMQYIGDEAWAGSGEGPSAMAIDENGNFYFVDSFNERIMIYSNNATFLKEIKLPVNHPLMFATEIKAQNNSIFGFDPDNRFCKIDLDGNTIYTVDFATKSISNDLDHGNYAAIAGELFLFTRGGKIVYFPNIGADNDANLKNRISGLNANSRSATALRSKNIIIDGKNRILHNNQLVTKNFQTFYGYQKETRTVQTSDKELVIDGFDLTKLTNVYYLGKDRDNNVYWRSGRSKVLVFSPEGFLIEAFKLDRNKSFCLPAVYPNGDVYFMSYDAKGVYVHRVKRVW